MEKHLYVFGSLDKWTSLSCWKMVQEYIFSFFADLLLGPLADGGETRLPDLTSI